MEVTAILDTAVLGESFDRFVNAAQALFAHIAEIA